MRSLAAALGRRRQTGSLCLRRRRLLRALIAATQETRFGPYVTPQTFELASEDPDALASGRREYDDGPRFFANFEPSPDLTGLTVLDLGCGYGGRTVYYARRCGAQHVTGIEIAEPVVERCRSLAARLGVDNADFEVGFAESLRFADGEFDAVVSYDVLEHVQDPYAALHEIARVLRPGGTAWLVFPTYLGARASHLDYLTQLPLLHRVFDLDTIVEVVNEFLAADPGRYGVRQQPAPHLGALGRSVLPGVNGMSRAEAMAIVPRTGLAVVEARAGAPIADTTPVPGASAIAAGLRAWERWRGLPDALVGHIALRLSRSGDRGP